MCVCFKESREHCISYLDSHFWLQGEGTAELGVGGQSTWAVEGVGGWEGAEEGAEIEKKVQSMSCVCVHIHVYIYCRNGICCI